MRVASNSYRFVSREVIPPCLAALLAVLAVPAVVAGSPRGTVFVAGAGAFAVGSLLWFGLRDRLPPGFIAVEAPVALLVFSTLVLRGRTSDELAYDPLDPAAMFRVLAVAVAAGLAVIALLSPAATIHQPRGTTLPLRVYALYILIVFAGAPLSAWPLLTGYRGVELAAAWLVVVAASRTVPDAADRILRVLYISTVVLLGSVWLGVGLWPDVAISNPNEWAANSSHTLPWQIYGVFPTFSANSVGALGAILTLWSLAKLLSTTTVLQRRWLHWALAAVGIITLVAAQYRTGYVAFAVGTITLVAIKKKIALVTMIPLVCFVIVLWGPSLVEISQPYALRGQSQEMASQLSGRLEWWEAAIQVWKQSPLLGRGLLTGTRFEVLAGIGEGSASTIHGTWVEVLVGTGILGAAALVAAALVVWRRALAEALKRGGHVLPLVFMTFLTVKSLTGSTFEAFSYLGLIFLAVAQSLRDAPAPAVPEGLETSAQDERIPDR